MIELPNVSAVPANSPNLPNEQQAKQDFTRQSASPFVEGTQHDYMYEQRKQPELKLIADVVGVAMKDGGVHSLVLRYKNRYVGHVSGLDGVTKKLILEFAQQHPGECPFSKKTSHDVMWLSVPFACKVSALEFTDSGQLKQPKLIGFGV